MVSRTARTSSANARATIGGRGRQFPLDVVDFGLRHGVQRVRRRERQEIGVARLGHDTPKQLRSPRMASRIRDFIVARFADKRSDTWT